LCVAGALEGVEEFLVQGVGCVWRVVDSGSAIFGGNVTSDADAR